MECPRQNGTADELILAYVAQTLEPETQIALERHMSTCAACRELAEQQKAVWDSLEAWTPASISADFDQRLYERIAADNQTPWWRRLAGADWSWAFRPAMPVAAACAALLIAFLLKGPSLRHDAQPQVQPKVSIEQVERALDDVDMLQQLSLATPVEQKTEGRI